MNGIISFNNNLFTGSGKVPKKRPSIEEDGDNIEGQGKAKKMKSSKPDFRSCVQLETGGNISLYTFQRDVIF